MGFQGGGLVDNRDGKDAHENLEAQIQVLKQRIDELEIENELLRSKLRSERGTISHVLSSRPNSY
jgi:cell division protein FtsB